MKIDEITTAAILSEKEIDLCRRGYSYMVDNGYGKITDMRDMLRSLAVSIEHARRERNACYVPFMRDTTRIDLLISCEEARFRNLAWRSGLFA